MESIKYNINEPMFGLVLRKISDPINTMILGMCNDWVGVSGIQEGLGISIQSVYQHVNGLVDANLLEVKKDDTRRAKVFKLRYKEVHICFSSTT